MTYDAVHRVISTLAPRYDDTYGTVRTDTRYDQDGNVTDTCPPRQFTDGAASACSATGTFSKHSTYNAAGLIMAWSVYQGDTWSGAPAPVLETTRYTYDANGNELTIIDPNSHTTTNTYDPLDRLTKTTVPRDASHQISFQTTFGYDASGNRVLTSEPVQYVTYPNGAVNTGARNTMPTTGPSTRWWQPRTAPEHRSPPSARSATPIPKAASTSIPGSYTTRMATWRHGSAPAPSCPPPLSVQRSRTRTQSS